MAKPKQDGKEEEARNKRLANVSAALDGMPKEVKDLIQVVDSEADAAWVLDVEGEGEGDRVVLQQGAGAALSDEAKRQAMQEAARERASLGQPEPPRVFGGYGADDVPALTRSWRATCRKSSPGKTSGTSRAKAPRPPTRASKENCCGAPTTISPASP